MTKVMIETKTYTLLYIISAPFTYLIYEISDSLEIDWFFLNIFIALSFWVYIKKIRPLLNESRTNGVNALLFLLVSMAILFSTKSVSLSSDIESEVYSIKYDMESIESNLSTLQNDVTNIEIEIYDLVYR